MLLIGIDKDGVLEENGWREIEEFTELEKRFGPKGIKALVLIWDSGSPYTRTKEEEREKRVSIQQMGQNGYEVFLKSSQYIKAKYLYQALDYDELIDSKRILQKKLNEINTQLDQIPFNVGNADKIKTYTQLQTKMLDDINKITVRIIERGSVKKDLQAVILSGIEIFYESARKNRREHLLFRNQMRIERRNLALKDKEIAEKAEMLTKNQENKDEE